MLSWDEYDNEESIAPVVKATASTAAAPAPAAAPKVAEPQPIYADQIAQQKAAEAQRQVEEAQRQATATADSNLAAQAEAAVAALDIAPPQQVTARDRRMTHDDSGPDESATASSIPVTGPSWVAELVVPFPN